MDERKETIDNRNDINKVEMIEREDITDNKGVIEKRDIIDNQEMIGIIDNLETAKKFSKTMMKIVMKKIFIAKKIKGHKEWKIIIHQKIDIDKDIWDDLWNHINLIFIKI